MTKHTAPVLLKKTPKGKKHSFYEISAKNDHLYIRYGTSSPYKGGGRRLEKQFPSHAKARKRELSKIRKKLDEGYHYVIHNKKHKFPIERAERTVKKLFEKEKAKEQRQKEREKQRQQRRNSSNSRRSSSSSSSSSSSNTTTTITNSTTSSTISSSSSSSIEYIDNKTVPKRWAFQGQGNSFGLCVTDKYCFIGDGNRKLYSLDRKSGALRNSIELDHDVLGIIYDNGFLYAGTDGGSIYDCTSEIPRLAYQMSDYGSVMWIDIEDGILSIAYSHGTLVQLNIEGEALWKGNTKASTESWVARSTTTNVFHAAEQVLRNYRFVDGNLEWEKTLPTYTFFATQSSDHLYISGVARVFKIKKENGDTIQEYNSKRNVNIYSCCHSEDESLVFACNNEGLFYCFDAESAEIKWQFSTGIGCLNSMQYYDGYVYGVANSGVATCIDVSDEAVSHRVEVNKTMARTKANNSSKGTSNAFNRYLTLDTLEQTDNPSEGVNLICVRDEKKNSLRIRSTSDGYHKDWNVQFPLNIRVEGYRYVCEELEVGRTGNFYRAKGFVKLLVDKLPNSSTSTSSSSPLNYDKDNNNNNNNDINNEENDTDTQMKDSDEPNSNEESSKSSEKQDNNLESTENQVESNNNATNTNNDEKTQTEDKDKNQDEDVEMKTETDEQNSEENNN